MCQCWWSTAGTRLFEILLFDFYIFSIAWICCCCCFFTVGHYISYWVWCCRWYTYRYTKIFTLTGRFDEWVWLFINNTYIWYHLTIWVLLHCVWVTCACGCHRRRKTNRIWVTCMNGSLFILRIMYSIFARRFRSLCRDSRSDCTFGVVYWIILGPNSVASHRNNRCLYL